MLRLPDIKHSIIAGFYGVQEAFLEVAEKVNFKVNQTKMLLAIRDLENKLENSHARLGELIYRLRGQNTSLLHENPEIHKILNSCKALHEKISMLREKYRFIDEGRVQSELGSLYELMEKRNIKLMRLTIDRKSSLKGCRIKDLKLPPDVLILCVLKKNRFILALGDTRIDDQDHIFVMGPEPQIELLRERNLPNPQ
jgi:hypothetical protein